MKETKKKNQLLDNCSKFYQMSKKFEYQPLELSLITCLSYVAMKQQMI